MTMLTSLRFFYKRIVVHSIERFIRRVTLIIKYLIVRKDINPIFVITSPRTGSYLLLDYLSSHPYIDSLGEVINPDIVRGIRTKFISKQEVLFHIKTSLNTSKSKNGVIKLMSDQMETHRLNIDDIRDTFPTAQFIILYRESLLKQYISNELSKRSGVWKLDKEKNKQRWDKSSITFEINPGDFQQFCESTKQFYVNILGKEWIKKEALILSYEELIGNSKDKLGGKLFSFLNLPKAEIKTDLKTMNERSAEEIVTNYHEIKELLEGEENLLTKAPVRK